MHSIVVKPINSEFIAVWVKLLIRAGHNLDELQLQPLQSTNLRQHSTITNQVFLDSLKTDFTNFRLSKLSMEEYFQTNIIHATRRTLKFHLPKETKLVYQKSVLVFRERTKTFYVEEELDNIQSFKPIHGSPSTIMSLFNLPPLDLANLEQYEKIHNVRLNILKLVRRTQNGKTVFKGQKHYSTPGCQSGSGRVINCAVENWPSVSLNWLPCDSLIDNQMGCTKTSSCKFTFEHPSDLKRHEAICSKEQKITSKQKFYGSRKSKMQEIIEAGFLPESFQTYRNKNLSTFDIETVQIQDHLHVISIAVGSTMDEVHYFERASSAPEDYQKLVNEFMSYLTQLQDMVEVPEEIENAINEIDEQLQEMPKCPQKSQLQSFKTYLRSYFQLHCFGFNSSRFDIPALIAGIVKYANANDCKVKTLKKGAKYITLEVDDIVFKDTLQYTSPCNLETYLRQWQAPEPKGIFPHGHFSNIESMRETLDFPDQSAFYSKLKQSGPTNEDYNNAKELYNERFRLPDGHPDKWDNFSAYLKWYNSQDVGPLVVALSNSFKKFYEFFGVDPLTKLSLPSIAFEASFSMFDQSLPYVSTFSKQSDEVRKLFRSNVIGGISNIYHRDIDLMGDQSPESARIAPNGDPFTSCLFIDYNSMYLWSQNQQLPLTPGLLWEMKNNKYIKSHMSSQISFKALQWIYMEQESDRCVDKNGNRVTIQHDYFQGEVTVFNAKVDGYALIDGVHVVWEFNGCYWHKCSSCYPNLELTIQDMERKVSWDLKIQRLKDNNCIIHIMLEHDFKPDVSIKTQMPRILLADTESSLIKAIRAEEVFGFLVCSIRTPDHLVKKFEDASFLFPPVIQRANITEDLISPFMKAQMIQQERKPGQSTLIQTYNGDDILIMSPLAKFYLDNGIEISNIQRFIQYLPGRGLAPFVEKVVAMRVAATYEGDDAKQLTAKLYGNSSYGKCAEAVDRHKNTSLLPVDYNIAKLARRPMYRDHVVIQDENGDACATEVTSLKQTVEDSKPVHIGVAILQWSKLLFLRFMFDLFKHMEPGSFRCVYSDTDSMCLALTKSRTVNNDSEEEKYRALFDPIVKKEMRASWEAMWKDWICATTQIEDIRTPGKLKLEFLFRRGRFCALSPKSYYAFNQDEEDSKTGYKGICHTEAKKLNLQTYLECLYGSTAKEIENRGFKLNKEKQLVYYEQKKRGLNNIFCKFRVQDDFITCKPLTKDGKVM